MLALCSLLSILDAEAPSARFFWGSNCFVEVGRTILMGDDGGVGGVCSLVGCGYVLHEQVYIDVPLSTLYILFFSPLVSSLPHH